MQRKNTQVYIVRLWKETTNGGVWRGKIQNVRSGQSVSVPKLNKLEELIRRCFDQETKTQPEQEGGLR